MKILQIEVDAEESGLYALIETDTGNHILYGSWVTSAHPFPVTTTEPNVVNMEKPAFKWNWILPDIAVEMASGNVKRL